LDESYRRALEVGNACGDVEAGIPSALTWVAREMSVYAANIVLTTVDDLWACQ